MSRPSPLCTDSSPAVESCEAELEARLACLWGEVLSLDPASLTRRSQFSLLGGSSLELLQLQRRVENAFGLAPRAGCLLPLGNLGAMLAHLQQRLSEEASGAAAAPRATAEPGAALRQGPLQASAGQGGLWFLQEVQGEAPTLYNCGMELAWEGDLDAAALERALNGLVRRHEALRCALRYPEGGKALLLEVQTELKVALPQRLVREEDLERLRRSFMAQPFVLHRPPLFRALLLKVEARRHYFLLALHHAVSDGWSGGLVLRELLAGYRQAQLGAEDALPPAAQYGEFCRWQQSPEASALFAAQRAWWRRLLSRLPPPALLPGEREGRTERLAGRAALRLCGSQTDKLERRAREAGGTLFAVLLAAYALLLARHCGVDELVLGCPAVNRRRLRWESAVGFFANPLPLRLRVAGLRDFPALMTSVQQSLAAALAQQDLPFAHMPALLGAGPDEDYPLFRHLFAYQDWRQDARLPGVHMELTRLKPDCCHYPLELEVTRDGEGLLLAFDFHAARFASGSIGVLLGDYRSLLSGLAVDEDPVTG